VLSLFSAFRQDHTSSGPERQLWPDAVPVLVDSSLHRSDFLRIAKSAGYERVSHQGNTMVPLFSFHGMIKVPVEKVSERYDSLDPLYDPFLKKLPALFSGSIDGRDAQVYYIITEDDPNTVFRRLSGVNSPYSGKFVVAGTGSGPVLLLPFIFLFLVIFFAFGVDVKSRLLFLLGSLPVAVFSFGTSFGSYAAILLFSPFWASLVTQIPLFLNERFRRGSDTSNMTHDLLMRAFRYLLFCVLSLIFFLIFSQKGQIKNVGSLFACLLAGPAMIGAAILWHYVRYASRQHALFVSVAISAAGSSEKRMLRFFSSLYMRCGFVLFCSSLLFLWPLFNDGTAASLSLPAPTPHSEVATATGFPSLGQKGDPLPSRGDYIAHYAFHDGYLFGMNYRVPSLNEALEYENYFYINDVLYSEQVTAKLFTEQWYEDIMVQQVQNGIIGLFLNQTNSVGLNYVSLASGGGTELSGGKLLFLLTVVLVSLVFSEMHNVFSSVKMEPGSRTVRSKEQAA
jgi:hypothetical protein